VGGAMILIVCGLRRESGASRHKGGMRLGVCTPILAVKVSQRGLGGAPHLSKCVFKKCVFKNVFLKMFLICIS
jgi:hypothetical protein